MVNAEAPVSMRRQCELLRVSRSGLYYEPMEDSVEDRALMRRLDELDMKWPFYGSRKLTLELRAEGHEVNRKRVQRLMRHLLASVPTHAIRAHQASNREQR